MRLSLPTLLLCAILLSTTAWSQRSDVPRHPDDPNAEMIGTLKFNITPQSEVQHERSIVSDATGCINGNVAVFRSEGRIDYCVDIESVKFLGDGGLLDAMSTKLLFDLVARTAILQGLADGVAACSSNCTQGEISLSRVYTAACVTRSGSGSGTSFKPCESQASAVCMREYSVCCPLGLPLPLITMIRSAGVPCGSDGTCESACP